MSSASKLHRALLVALTALALGSPAAVAAPAQLRLDPPTSSLAGTTEENVFGTPRDSALAQERAYSTYGTTAPPSDGGTTTDSGEGIAWLPFVLAVSGALVVGLAGGSRLHLVSARRDTTRPAT
jgi:hypothetical protein